MRTTYPLLLVLALGVSGMIWGMSGIEALYNPADDDVSDSQSLEDVSDSVNSSAEEAPGDNSSLGGEAEADNEGSIIGFIINGVQTMMNMVAMVVLLPLTLMDLGFPRYFAIPIGILFQVIVGIGIIQFATNREYK